MYSSFDYFSKWLLFKSYLFYESKQSNEVFSLFSKSKKYGMTKCSSGLLSDIGVILEKSGELGHLQLSHVIDLWAGEVSLWKESGLFLTVLENMSSFVNRSSVVVDNSVFLLPNSSTDLERNASRPVRPKLPYLPQKIGIILHKRKRFSD